MSEKDPSGAPYEGTPTPQQESAAPGGPFLKANSRPIDRRRIHTNTLCTT